MCKSNCGFLVFVVIFACLSSALGAEPAKIPDPLAPWLTGLNIHPVTDQPNRHTIHSYYVTSPESPDGKWVLFYTSTARTAEEEGEIHIRERATGVEKVLARHITTEDAHRAACQQWISGGRRVAYHDVRDGHWVVAVVDVDTGAERVLARDHQIGFGTPAGDVVPIYGPHWNPGEHRDIELLNVDTGKITTAVTAAAVKEKYGDWVNKSFAGQPISLFFPVLSPDQKRMFFKIASARDGSTFRSAKASLRLGLIAFDVEGSRFLLLRQKWGHPAWATDSHTVVEPGGVIVDTNDDSSRTTPGLPRFRGDHPSFSPDMQLIVTDTTLDNFGGKETEWGVILIRASDGKHEFIHKADNSHGASSWRPSHPHPAWSPDGRRLYFNVNSSGWTQLFVAELGKQ